LSALLGLFSFFEAKFVTLPLCLITGNAHKLREAQALMPEISGWEIDLPEIQHSEPMPVIEAKLLAALALAGDRSRLLVEDTGLYLAALNGLPGPLIKWFLAPGKPGLNGLWQIAQALGETKAEAITVIGYLEKQASGLKIAYYTGSISGQIVAPRGEKGFGWDAIFLPDGSDKTFAEMDAEEKSRFSMRALALAQLRESLNRV
jgi:non-canonical purine NTP pyrophosphatase (RdgB/HAM1 family)